MSIPYQCNTCGHEGQAADKFGGRIIKCPRCKDPVELPGVPTQPSPIQVISSMPKDKPEAPKVDLSEREWRDEMLSEFRETAKHIEKMQGHVGCMFYWLVFSIIGAVLVLLFSSSP